MKITAVPVLLYKKYRASALGMIDSPLGAVYPEDWNQIPDENIFLSERRVLTQKMGEHEDPLGKWNIPVSLLERFSLNQKTTIAWTLREAAEACARRGFRWFGPRVDALRKTGLTQSLKIFDDCGLEISSVCFSGKFVALDVDERKRRIDDCLRAIDDTAAVSGNVLVIMPGTDARCSVEECRVMIDEGLARVLPYAEKNGVVLGLEPLHPVYAADLSIIVTLGEALDILDRFNSPYLKVTVDVFHTWWDPQLSGQIKRAKGRIGGYHVSDWVSVKFGPNSSRGMMGDGMIPLRPIRAEIEDAGYFGPIEVEIFNEDLWHMPCEEVLDMCLERYKRFV
jgi:sugar phosphate isomerase/epimerase